MWLLERRGEFDLAGESRRRERVGELGWQHLDDDFPAEGFVAGHEHAGHSARAQFTLYRVVAAPERLLELYEEVVQRFLGAGSLMYAEEARSSYAPTLLPLTTIWIIRSGETEPRFVTAYPVSVS